MDSNGLDRSRAIIVSGLPASGKTTVGVIIATELNFAFIDKDELLEQLFDEHPSAGAPSRRALSRESDVVFEKSAKAESNVVLVSHWRPVGIDGDSGTPTQWLLDHYDTVMEVSCACSVRTAAVRFKSRHRHSGHEDRYRSLDEIEAWLVSLADWFPLNIGESISIGTERKVDVTSMIRRIEVLL